MNNARAPVIVGVGQINDRPANAAEGLNSLELMQQAAQRADADAGGGWLQRLDSVATVAQLSFWELGDTSEKLSAALGVAPRFCTQSVYPSGASPILFLNEAANRIAAGEAEVALVAGAEALRTAAARAAAKDASARTDAVRAASERGRPSGRQRYGLAAPVDVYPLYENATRAAWKQSLAEAQAESAALWSLMSGVAAGNEHAWLRKPLSPADILTINDSNRPIAFPYTKLMVANASVNQGAAFIVTSAGAARAAGIPAERLVYVGYGAAADEPGDILKRDRFDRSVSMEVSLRRTLELNGLAASNLDCAELYSCFPCVPKMARRVIGWPIEKPITVFGGLTFGGGPIGNYMSHAVASMTEQLRVSGQHGLLFANGGFATQNHSIIVSRDPARATSAPRSFDFQAEADSARGSAPALLDSYAGPAVIETYTVFYERDGAPRFGAIVARTPKGARFLAKVLREDEAMLRFLTDGQAEPVGASGHAVVADEEVRWRAA
ncbi:MAG: hypothetical protein JNJ63_07055 [Hyphomonadaceae bacterium]|nr:hypothetical protein [Hyphomonadaceae bacterium]